MSPTDSRPAHPLAGVAYLIAASFTLSVMDATARYLVLAGVPVLMLAWIRYTVHVTLLTAYALPRGGAILYRSAVPGLQLLRGVLLIVCTLLFFSTLGYLPLAEATALGFTAPLIVMALSPWLLGEPARLARWIGILVAFAGMLIVIRPGGGLHPVGIGLGLLTAIAFAAFHMVTRLVARDSPLTSNFYSGMVGMLGLAPIVPFVWRQLDLGPWQWALLLSTGCTGALGHLLHTSAFRAAPASLLSPFAYVQILAATMVGWLVFGNVPDTVTSVGMTTIFAAGVGVALSERRAR
ncbi:MAG: DMT family transporter [Burkholderiales bacterium]|nr:MAG: DMT family transporter [Burkholderiales bacterium]